MDDNLDWVPPFSDLDDTPELAVLAMLRAILPVVSCALLAANPEPAWHSSQPHYAVARAARVLLVDIDLLRKSIDRYRSALATLPSSIPALDDDLPF